jgi:DNA mismatch endonuclease (patch repair protein)
LNGNSEQVFAFGMDTLTPEQRSRLMSRVRGSNTGPELTVRSTLHRMGFRFRLNRKDLPGRPDMVLPRFKLAVFVHGCFWHRHPRCKKATTPAHNRSFWITKFRANRLRDRRCERQLKRLGWNVATIWECETADEVSLRKRISEICICR